jgi:hypothetical protein
VLVIVVIAAFYAGSQATEPFDEATGTWYGSGEYLGSVAWATSKQFQERLKAGDFRGAGAMMTTMAMPLPRLDISVRRSRDTTADMILDVQESKQGNRGDTNSTDVLTGVVSPQEFDDLQRSISNPNIP